MNEEDVVKFKEKELQHIGLSNQSLLSIATMNIRSSRAC